MEVTKLSPHLKSRELCSISLRAKYLPKLLTLMLHRFVYSLPCTYSIIYLYKHGIIGIYFVLWVIIQCYFIYLVAQIVPALVTGSSFSRPLFFFNILPSLCVCVIISFLSGTTRWCPRLIFPAPVLESAIFLRHPTSSHWRMILKPRCRHWVCLLLLGCRCF